MSSGTANLILLDTYIMLGHELLLSWIEKPQKNNSYVLKLMVDNIDDTLRVFKLETILSSKSDTSSL